MGAISAATSVLIGAICLQPHEVVVREKVDLIEVNHFFDERGKLVLDQIIFYDWSPEESRYQVCAWRLLKCSTQLPRRDARRGGFVTIWQDGSALRKIRSPSVRETWTLYDPEVADREFLPKDRRRELRKPLSVSLDGETER